MKKSAITVLALALVASSALRAADRPKTRSEPTALPVALSSDFEFRKTKLFRMDPTPPKMQGSKLRSFSKGNSAPDASIAFERSYRLFGAATALDQRQRFGDYFDFFWQAKREADVTVRLEYRQEKLRSFVQSREVSYHQGRGHHKTEFAIIGDDYLDDGHTIAWRCLLIADGRIVAENRSYLWK
ncbi:MAG: hypothetical protein M3Z64_06275 [Verrucomicrobiota bacterium]|nr:hypothetical protein [Verrucomicrobiota bacterium]